MELSVRVISPLLARVKHESVYQNYVARESRWAGNFSLNFSLGVEVFHILGLPTAGSGRGEEKNDDHTS
jgi:hypothetical protein